MKRPFKSMLDDSLSPVQNRTINVIDPDPEIPVKVRKKETINAQKIENGNADRSSKTLSFWLFGARFEIRV
jgi:hypothetical protein